MSDTTPPHPLDERCLDCATDEELERARPGLTIHTNPAPPCPYAVSDTTTYGCCTALVGDEHRPDCSGATPPVDTTAGASIRIPTRSIPGYCPMGCGQTLFLASGNYITCSWVECPNPTAVSDLLADPETEHVVELRERDFNLKHPLRERLDDALLDCDLHVKLRGMSGPPGQPGRYRVRSFDSWERLDVPKPAAQGHGTSEGHGSVTS